MGPQALTTAAALCALSLPLPAQDDPEPRTGTGLELAPRTVTIEGQEIEVTFGRLSVPENRSRESSRRIQVAFARMHSAAEEPRPPVFYLAGGPGSPGTALVRSTLALALLRFGDVVLIDQRGIGESRPPLEWESDEIRPELFFGDQETATEHALALAARAAGELGEEGFDLAGYTTTESADDVDDLRAALGYERVTLWGFSYGTHLGQEVIRRHGAHVDRFVSVGTAGMNDIHKLPGDLDESLRRLSAVVAADPTVGEAVPDLFGLVERVLAQVEEEPLAVMVSHGGRPVEVAVGRFGLQLILMMDLGDTSDLPVFPRLLKSVEAGDTSLLRWFVQKRLGAFASMSPMTYVCRGASGATAARWRDIRRQGERSPFGTVRTMFSPGIDGALGTPDLGDGFRKPVESDVPALFVSGTLDANTPPDQAERVKRGFARSGHVVVENAGHEDLLRTTEVREHVFAFLAGGEPEDAVFEAPRLRFVPLEGYDPSVTHPSVDALRR